MKKLHLLVCLFAGLPVLFSATVNARQDSGPTTDPVPLSAGALFEDTLREQGLEEAVARFRKALADTTGRYEFDGQELIRVVPNRLTMAGRRDAALELIKLLETRFGDHPVYWKELAGAHLKMLDPVGAEAALRRSLEIDPDQPDIPWTLGNLDRLTETLRVQIDAQDRYHPGENTGLQGPYLGQDPPGARPEVFAPGVLSTLGHEYSISFAPDGREIIFSRGGSGTFVCRWEEDGWTAPEFLVLMDEEHLTEEASIAPDGGKIFFCARPLDMRGRREIHMADREGAGWGAPRYLFPGMYPTAALDGTLYYTETEGRPDYGVLVKRVRLDGEFGEPEVLAGGNVNTGAPDAHPFITPDQSLLIFDSMREEGTGLYASFRKDDGSWGEAFGLADSLGIPPAGQGALSPDGRYLFFCLAGDMYWVDVKVLTEGP